MKKLFIASALAVAASTSAYADTIFGIYASAGQWSPDYSGKLASGADSAFDLQDDLGFDSAGGATLSLAVEHPVPLIPNVRFSSTELKSDAEGSLIAGTFGGVDVSGNTTTELDLSHKDYLLYYELLDNWITIDFGLNARQFDGEFSIDGANKGEATLDGTLPMLYLRGDVELPFTGLALGAEVMGISAGDASMKDIKLKLAYEFSFGLGIEVGQRTFTFTYEDDGAADDEAVVDLEFKGTYAAATFHF